ncbi:type II toxin-antitoxin system PemK/MazF family toxin [Massilia sp. Root418]|jgi:mRNA interferase MazF|uniref:type II toxin-antitoxin system PemK/MazF family toxin n=1 Tax=Massilia sp. Root418 TaxID=1736532 RepID=UPI0006F7887B|nr:type II toxin-antitoxin system PemK/MazF family toxin [Massilia sp. Root418]
MAPGAKSNWCLDRGEIISIQHSPQAGKEIPGVHPMLVSSPRAFNERTGIVIGFPMTHAEFNTDNPFAVAVQGPKHEIGYILAFQPKSFDWRERKAGPHPWGGGHETILAAALAKLDTICGISQP